MSTGEGSPVDSFVTAERGGEQHDQCVRCEKVLIDIDMKLFEGKDGKTEVECFYSTPSKPTNPESAPGGAWCLIPKHKLKDKMDYKVVANWNTGGRGTDTSIGKHVEWTFKTK